MYLASVTNEQCPPEGSPTLLQQHALGASKTSICAVLAEASKPHSSHVTHCSCKLSRLLMLNYASCSSRHSVTHADYVRPPRRHVVAALPGSVDLLPATSRTLSQAICLPGNPTPRPVDMPPNAHASNDSQNYSAKASIPKLACLSRSQPAHIRAPASAQPLLLCAPPHLLHDLV